MSNLTHWIFAQLLIFFAIGAAMIAIFSGGISIIGC
jgi:hypothetical protein